MIEIFNIVFLSITIIASLGLSYIIYSRSAGKTSSKLFVFALLLVAGYIISHAVHFLLMPSSDVTIFDQSCHSLLLLIIVVLTFFSYYFPEENQMPLVLRLIILLPTLTLLILLWNGNLVTESHAHLNRFEAQYSSIYFLYLIWYILMILLSVYFLISKFVRAEDQEKRIQLLTILIGLIITNFTAFVFGLYLPWVFGFYYLVEMSPLAFLIGFILTTTIAVTRFNMFPSAINKFDSFSLTKKVFFSALVIVPIVILMIQIPLGRVLFNIESTAGWERYFFMSLFSGILVSVTMAFVIIRVIANPINKMREKTSEIGKGNYGITVDIKSNDEIGQLAETFNRMSSTLKNDSIEITENQQRISILLTAFEKSDTAICILDKSGYVQEMNHKFAGIFCPDLIDLKKKKLDEICQNKELNEFLTEVSGEHEADYNFQREIKVNSSGEQEIYFLMASPFYMEEDIPSGYLLVLIDITRIKTLEAELAKSEKLAALGKMAAVLTHEIKTPLTSIKLNNDILMESLDLDEKGKKSFEIINREINRLNNLVKEVLQFSRQMELIKSEFSILSLITEITKQISIRINENRFKIVVDVEDIDISADREKLYQVILNLIDNAIDAKSEEGQLSIFSSVDDGKLHLNFKDNGKGVPEEEKNKIFEPFYTTKSAGTGLGLAVAQKIILQHSGSIKLIKSNPGETLFQIILPLN